MLESGPVVALGAAFLLALCIAIYGGIGLILRVKRSFAESTRLWGPPQKTVDHEVLGKIETRGCGLWEALAPAPSGEVLVLVSGTEEAPHDAAVANAVRRLPDIDKLRVLASGVVRESDSSLSNSHFELYGLECSSDDDDSCIVEITTKDDLDGVWRVEIRGESATLLGRDD